MKTSLPELPNLGLATLQLGWLLLQLLLLDQDAADANVNVSCA